MNVDSKTLLKAVFFALEVALLCLFAWALFLVKLWIQTDNYGQYIEEGTEPFLPNAKQLAYAPIHDLMMLLSRFCIAMPFVYVFAEQAHKKDPAHNDFSVLLKYGEILRAFALFLVVSYLLSLSLVNSFFQGGYNIYMLSLKYGEESFFLDGAPLWLKMFSIPLFKWLAAGGAGGALVLYSAMWAFLFTSISVYTYRLACAVARRLSGLRCGGL